MQKKYKVIRTDDNEQKLNVYTETGEATTALELLKNFEGKNIFLFKGQMGAGKTTFINLLMRFYDVNIGQIKEDELVCDFSTI